MKLVVLKETYQREARVALTPSAVKAVIQQGFDVCVEEQAGMRAGFSDQAYLDAGASVTNNQVALYSNASIITWVKPPADLEAKLVHFPENVIVIGFTNPFQNNSIVQLVNSSRMKIISLELLPRKYVSSRTDAFGMMSKLAGRIAYSDSSQLHRSSGGTLPHTVLIIGAGQAGMAAAHAAAEHAAVLFVVASSDHCIQEVQEELQGRFIHLSKSKYATLSRQQDKIRQLIVQYQPDIVITAARQQGKVTPLLLPRHSLDLLPKNCVVIDLTASAGGNTAVSAIDRIVQIGNGVRVCNKTNYPSAEPQTASQCYAHCITEITKLLMQEMVM